MYSAADRKHIASVNGSFHERYPCNYDQNDKPKRQVGMADAEYKNYMAAVAKETTAATHTLKWCRPQRKRKCDTKRNKSHDARRCANKKYLDTGREAARLQGEIFDKESQLLSSQQHIREFERMERYRRSVTSQMEFELERQTQRAEAAERECRFRKEDNVRLTMRVRELEKRVLRERVRSALQPFEG